MMGLSRSHDFTMTVVAIALALAVAGAAGKALAQQEYIWKGEPRYDAFGKFLGYHCTLGCPGTGWCCDAYPELPEAS